MEIDIKKDYYAVLGVSPFATQEEIKGAYRRLARRYHPDSREAETATGLFHAVHEAYAVLSDSVDRSAYDRQRDEQEIEETLPFTWDLSQSPTILSAASEEQTLHVLLKLRPEVGASRERLPLDLAMVIDRSTSMKGPRLAGVKEAAHQIVDQLGDDDFLTIVSFNDRPDVLVSDQVGSSRARAKTAITSLRAEGGTELLTGLEAGLQQLWGYRGRNAVSHLILLTDGRTYGDDEACVAAAASAGDRDIGITAMGIGEDWNDDLLDEMAARSGGTSDYISSSGQVYPLLQAVIRRLSSVFATELMLGIRVAEGVSIEGVFQTKPSVERLHTPEGVARLAPLGVDGARRVLIQAAVMAGWGARWASGAWRPASHGARATLRVAMKRLTLALVAIVAVALMLGANLGAQDAPTRIAFVDSQALIASHPAGQSANELRDLATEEIGELRGQLDGLQTKAQAEGLSNEEAELFDVLVATLESVQSRYAADIADAAQPAIEAVNAAIREVAEQAGVAIVLDIEAAAESGMVVYAADGLDLTEAVADLLD